MKPNIGIIDENLKNVSDKLNTLLADEFLLYTKTRNAHWNVEGSDFMDKHKFFENQFEELAVIMDAVAERIRSLGHYALGTLADYLKVTQLTEKSPRENNSSLEYIADLLKDHESICVFLRALVAYFDDDCKDMGSSDFVTGLLQQHEKMAWFLRSHL